MSQRARAKKSAPRTSSSKTKKGSGSISKTTRSNAQQKNNTRTSSPMKRTVETSSPAVTRRQKRLSGLTAATLLQYCTNILSPSQSIDKKTKTNNKRSRRSNNTSPAPRTSPKKAKRNSSKQSITIEAPVPVRTRREASSRASAMIMQQNEIERSRFNYNTVSQTSTVTRRPVREKTPPPPSSAPSSSSVTAAPIQTPALPAASTKPSTAQQKRTPLSKELIATAPEPFQFNVPSVPIPIITETKVPSVTNVSSQTEYAQSSNALANKSSHSSVSKLLTNNEKYSVLTEALLAEHDRYYGTIPSYHLSKRDNLIKWTQQLTTYDCMSPPPLDSENSTESPSENSLQADSILSSNHPPVRNRSFPKELSTVSMTNTQQVTMINSFPSTTATSSLHPLSRSYSFSFGQPAHEHSFLPTSSAYPLDLRSFYPILPCWQYPGWTFQSPTALVSAIPTSLTSFRSNSPKTCSTKPKKSQFKIAAPTTSAGPSVRTKQTLLSPRTESLTLHLHTHHHHHIHNANGSEAQLITTGVSLSSEISKNDETFQKKSIDDKQTRKRSTSCSSSTVTSNEVIKKTNRRKSSSPIKRSNQTSQLTDKNRRSKRGQRTRSSPVVAHQSTSSPERKRTHSSTSVNLPPSKRKRRRNQQNWTLFGEFERKLVLIDSEKLPVYRKCYTSIQHNKEKDIIRSGDCVLLRSDSRRHNKTTPLLAKVKYFWEEPLSGEVLMSIIWYYHPGHTELPTRIKEHFLSNELLASKYWDCTSTACIEDKCYVLNSNEYSRYCSREKSPTLFDHPEALGRLKSMLNKTNIASNHRSLPPKSVDGENIFFCRYVYDYRAKRIIKNPSLSNNFDMNATAQSQTS